MNNNQTLTVDGKEVSITELLSQASKLNAQLAQEAPQETIEEATFVPQEEVVEEKVVAKEEVVQEEAPSIPSEDVVKEEVLQEETEEEIVNIDDDDDEFADVENILERDEIIDVIRTKVVERLRPNKLDLNSFTVAKDPIKVVNLVTGKKDDLGNTIDWYLPVTGVNITMKKFDGTEIVALSGSNSSKSVRNMNLDILQLIYDHIINANKPEFNEWINIVAYEDLEQLYFAILVATFKDGNYITYACENNKCKDIDVVAKDYKDMIVFYEEKDKEEFFENIERKSYTYPMKLVEMERVQITDEYCIDIKLPSLYDSLIEPTYLTEKYRTKHQEKLAIIGFIGDIYKIDAVQGILIPIDYSLKTDNDAMIIKNKYRLYMQFLNSLTSDEYSYLTSIINKVASDKEICSFVIPEHKCEKCNTVIAPKKSSALRLLFTRHQLAALATI